MTETVVARLRPHSRALFWPTVLLLAVAAALGFLARTFPEQWQNTVMLSVAGVLLLVGWLAPLLRWTARTYTITTRRVIVSTGLIARRREEVLVARISGVDVERRGLQTLFRSGDVYVNPDAEHPLVLADVPSANLVQAAIHDLVEGTDRSPEGDRVRA